MALGFHNVQFPTDVSYGSSGGPRFKTQVFTSHRGYEKRNIEWCQPLMEFNVAYGIKTDEQMLDVINFYNARQGRAYAFRYKNWTNYNVVNAPIATGDGVSTRLPLWKFYGFQSARQYKRLRKIVRGSVTDVGIGAVGSLVEGTDYSIDYNEGEIAFNTAPGYGTPVYCSNLEFDEPVRFEEDNLQAVIDNYNNQSLSSLKLISIRTPFTSGSVFGPDLSNTEPDPFFDKTWLVLNFDDISSLTTTSDQSDLSVPVTFEGTATLDSTTYHNGSGSFSAGTGRIVMPGTPYDLSLLQPFTIEVFAQQPDTGLEQQQIIGRWTQTGDQRGWVLRYISSTKELQFVVSTDGSDESIICTTPWESYSSTAFDYITVDRLTNNWYVMRINGNIVASRQDTGAVNASTGLLSIGQVVDPTSAQGPYTGLIDSVRVTVGRARHTDFESISIPGTYSVSG